MSRLGSGDCEFVERLQQFCRHLRLLWTQAGGPTLRVLSERIGMSKSQLGAILNGKVQRLPDWKVVRGLVENARQYAHDHNRTANISFRTEVEEYWKPRYRVLELALEGARSRSDADRKSIPLLPPVDGSNGGASAPTRLGDAKPVVVLLAMATVENTDLVLQLASHIAEHFPDGQLYADVRGLPPPPCACTVQKPGQAP